MNAPTSGRALLTMAELRIARPNCATCGAIIQSNVIHRNRAKHFCSRTCYYQHRRAGFTYVQNRCGQRRARKAVSRVFTLPRGAVVHHHDRNTLNNDLSNLAVFASHAEHLAYHHGNPTARPMWDGRLARSRVA